MRKLTVVDVRITINQICAEVEEALTNGESEKYFYLLLLVHSLIENFLKWLVGTKQCWDESCREVDADEAGRHYEADLIQVRKRAKNLSFNDAITQGRSLGLFGVRLEARLHRVRMQRNDYAHELWVIADRKNGMRLRSELEYLDRTVEKLIKVGYRLIYEEIGVDIPEVFDGL